jgi:hypothetical protein
LSGIGIGIQISPAQIKRIIATILLAEYFDFLLGIISSLSILTSLEYKINKHCLFKKILINLICMESPDSSNELIAFTEVPDKVSYLILFIQMVKIPA